MFRIFRQRYTVADKTTGKRITKTSSKWYISVPQGKSKRPKAVPGFRDRRATEALALQLEQKAERTAAGILSPEHEHAARPIADHVADYVQHLEDKGDSPGHVKLTRRRLETLVDGAGWTRIGDMDQSGVLAYLAKLRAGKGPSSFAHPARPAGRETCNHYIRAVRAFASWLVKQRRAMVNPLAGLATSNPEVDRRHVRRVLSAAEFGKLLTATAVRTYVRNGLCGADRRVLYLLAAYTGLRCGELARLTPRQLQLDAEPPHVIVDAASDKAGRGASIPLPASVAVELRAWLAGRITQFRNSVTGHVFPPGSWRKHAAKMLRGDLKAAGIPYRDGEGRVFDFHALRSQYATNLARAGVDLRTTQRLMRHSTPALTAKHYTRLELEDLADAANRLPPPG